MQSSRLLYLYLPLSGLGIAALVALLHFGRDLFVPMTIALLLRFILMPPVRQLRRGGVPLPLGALTVMIALFIGFAVIATNLMTPALHWMETLPRQVVKLERTAREWQRSLQRLTMTADNLGQRLTPVFADSVPVVRIQEGTLAENMMLQSQRFILLTSMVFVLSYFLLAYGDSLLDDLASLARRRGHVPNVRHIVGRIEGMVSTYLGLAALINVCLAAAESLAMYLLGVPNPVLWGLMCGVLNFVPYMSEIVGTAVVFLVALATFDDPTQIVLAPAVFAAITTLEGSLITPIIIGRRFQVNPIIIFSWLLLWTWLWGAWGAVLAAPMLIAVKILIQSWNEPTIAVVLSPQQVKATETESSDQPVLTGVRPLTP